MKIVLIKDVAHLGQKGAIVEVANGYGINYLIPRGLALKADSSQGLSFISLVESGQMAADSADAALRQDINNLVGEQFNLVVEANELGGLFANLTPKKVAEMLKTLTQVKLNTDNIELPAGSIKEVGEYTVIFKHGGESLGEAMLNVTSTV